MPVLRNHFADCYRVKHAAMSNGPYIEIGQCFTRNEEGKDYRFFVTLDAVGVG